MDKIIHGLDLPYEIAKRNAEIMMEELGITDEMIEEYIKNNPDEDDVI